MTDRGKGRTANPGAHGNAALAVEGDVPDRRLILRDVLGALIEDGYLARETGERVLAGHRAKPGDKEHPLEIVARHKCDSLVAPHGPLDLERLTRWLAGRAGLPYVRIDPLKIDAAAVSSVVSYPYAARFQILPMAIDRERLLVATAEPFLREWERELARLLRVRIERVVANPAEVKRYLTQFYNLKHSIRGATSQANEKTALRGVLNLEQLVELGRTDQLDANDQHIVNIVDWLLQYAFEQRASDIHLEPRRDAARVRFRIDGVLHQVHEIPPVVLAAVTSRIKTLGRMDLVEKRRPQDGRLKTKSPGGREVELRLSTMPTAFGEKLVLRIFDPEVLMRSFADLGLGAHDTERWQAMLRQPHGIILVTGPTGSGKTTTLYSALRQLARPEVNVCTVEDPIEMVEARFNQMQVQPNIGLDFAAGVRNLLRQDPDIIMVGEIRDLPTAEMAIQAALTGHLVLSTLHTNDAASALTRLLDIGVPPYLIKATLVGVVAQRLLRTLCPHCKQPLARDDAAWALCDTSADAQPQQASGCFECRQTGYRGRVGIYEILTVSPELRGLVNGQCDVNALRDQARKDGMRTLRACGVEKICTGATTLDELNRVAPAVEEVY